MKRVILGQRNAGEYGLWVSKPGKDAFSAANADFMINPNFYLGQPFLVGTIYATSGNGFSGPSVNTQITHNLGYRPVVAIFGTYNGAPAYVQVNDTYIQCAPNATNIGYNIDVTYVIYRNRMTA